jgi:hypothetical protein
VSKTDSSGRRVYSGLGARRRAASRDWIKVKNPDSPAMIRAREPAAPLMAEAPRRFPAPWRAEPMPGRYVVRDANGQSLAYVCSRQDPTEAIQAKTLTADEGRRLTKVQRLTKVGRRWDGHRRQVSHGLKEGISRQAWYSRQGKTKR